MMKIVYFDTSALVKRYYKELGSNYVKNIFATSSFIVTSKIAYPEVLSALARKKREKNISTKDYFSLKKL